MGQVLQNTPKPQLMTFASSTVMVGFAESAFWLIIPLYATALGYDLISVGTITAIAAGITALGVGHFGALSDRWGRRTSLLASMGLMLAACLLLLLFHSFAALALFGGLFTLGRSAGYMNTRAFTADLASSHHRASALSVHELLITGGRTVGPLVAGILLDSVGATWAFGLLALSTSSVIILLLLSPHKK
jgi:ENTS family enterobactin (siderophore) exporter